MRFVRSDHRSRSFPGLLFVAVFVLVGCAQLLQPRPAPTAWDSPLPRSAKGYELYSWPSEQGNGWQFTLITGTNRLKSYEEIVSAEDIVSESGWVKVSVTGTEDLKALLRQLPDGESIIWNSGDWLEQMGAPAGSIRLPDENVIDEIDRYCRQLGLELSVARAATSGELGVSPGSASRTPKSNEDRRLRLALAAVSQKPTGLRHERSHLEDAISATKWLKEELAHVRSMCYTDRQQRMVAGT